MGRKRRKSTLSVCVCARESVSVCVRRRVPDLSWLTLTEK